MDNSIADCTGGDNNGINNEVVLQQLQQCPECQTKFSCDLNGSHPERLPTSCHWCFYTICCDCVDKLCISSENMAAGINARSFTVCPRCDKQRAFPTTAKPTINLFACQLLEQVQILQGQAGGTTNASTNGGLSYLSPAMGATPRRRGSSVGDASLRPKRSSLRHGKTVCKTTTSSSLYPVGTLVFTNNDQLATISSSSKHESFQVQYGDGDPEWVSYDELKPLVQAAKRQRQQSGDNLSGSPLRGNLHPAAQGKSLVGQAIYKEFPYMGWYWGKVIHYKLERTYEVELDKGQIETVTHENLRLKDEAVQGGEVTETETNDFEVIENIENPPPPTLPRTIYQQPKQHKPFKRRKSSDSTGSSSQKQTPQTHQSKKPRTYNKNSEVTPRIVDGQMELYEGLRLPIQAKSSRWPGFERYITNQTKLPTKLRDIFVMLDFFFVVTPGYGTFMSNLWDLPQGKLGWNGEEVRQALRVEKQRNAPGIRWHQKGMPYTPQTKNDLRDFLKLIINLRISPPVDHAEDYTYEYVPGQGHEQQPPEHASREKLSEEAKEVVVRDDISRSTKQQEDDDNSLSNTDDGSTATSNTGKETKIMLHINDQLALNKSSWGTGWAGFNLFVNNFSLPQQLSEILELLDFLFPIAPGETTFVESAKLGQEGVDLCDTLKEIEQQQENGDGAIGVDGVKEGLVWHTDPEQPYVPKTKPDLASFMNMIMNLPRSPRLVLPELQTRHYESARQEKPVARKGNEDENKLVQLDAALQLPKSSKGSGWKGFQKHISDTTTLPSSYVAILKLMDHLFPVAPGESFAASLLHAEDDIRSAMESMQAQNPGIQAFGWYKDNATQFVPPSHEELRLFINLLLTLEKAPARVSGQSTETQQATKDTTREPAIIKNRPVFNQNASDGRRSTSPSLQAAPPKKAPSKTRGVVAFSTLNMPVSAQATGWQGFERYVFDENCPKSMKSIIKMMDFLFPTNGDEATYEERLWINAGVLGQANDPGSHTRIALKNLRRDKSHPSSKQLQWMKGNPRGAPKTKYSLRELIKILMQLYSDPNFNGPSNLMMDADMDDSLPPHDPNETHQPLEDSDMATFNFDLHEEAAKATAI